MTMEEEESLGPMSVSAIVITHNRPQSLMRLLDSLELNSSIVEVIVVDDGSDDPVSPSKGGVRIVRNDHPRLASAARNQGGDLASGDLILFIDDDCVAAPEAANLILRSFQRNPRLGIGGPLLGYLSDPQRIWSAGAQRSRWTGRTVFPGRGDRLDAAIQLEKQCDSFPSCFAILRDLFDDVGGFDESVFSFHMEEEDLAQRVRARGYEVRLVPESLFWHDIEPREPFIRSLHISTTGAYHVARNRTLFIRRHSPGRVTRLLWLAFWLAVLVPVYLTAIIRAPRHLVGNRFQTAKAFNRGLVSGLVTSLPPAPGKRTRSFRWNSSMRADNIERDPQHSKAEPVSLRDPPQ